MKKKYLSIVVIIFTVLAIYFMIHNTTVYEDDYMMVQENNNKELRENLFITIESKEKEFNLKNIKENKERKIETLNKKENNLQENITKNEIEKEEVLNNIKENSNKNIKGSEELFKVDKMKIIEMLTNENKSSIKYIIKKLSLTDYANIVYSIKNNGELECCLKIITILNKRLDEDDYMMAKEIFEPYINVEFLEQQMLSK